MYSSAFMMVQQSCTLHIPWFQSHPLSV